MDNSLAAHPGMTPSRVVVINDISVPRGGATSIALATATAMTNFGIPATFITGDAATDIAPEHGRIEFEALGGQHILEGTRFRAAMRGIFSRHTQRVVSDWVANNDTPTTVYHLHGWSKSLSPSIFAALRPVSSRVVVHAHDHFLVCPNGGYFDYSTGTSCDRTPLSMQCLAHNCDRRSYRHKLWRSVRQSAVANLFRPEEIGVVLPVHEEMVPLLERGGIAQTRMRTLRNPVSAWRTERVDAASNEVFLYVGRLDSDKGVLQLAEAAHEAGIHLRMIGTGPLESKLRQSFPKIELTGWRSRSEIAGMLDDVRMFIMPSTCRETFGLAIFEALLSGIPVAVSEHVMAAREIATQDIGLVFDPSDRSAFAETLRTAANDSQLIDKLSRKAFDITSSLVPSEAEWAAELLQIYKDILVQSQRL